MRIRTEAAKQGATSIRRIAALVGVDHTVMLGIFTYHRPPSANTIAELANVFGGDIEEWERLSGRERPDRVRERHATYLIEKKGWTEEEVREMFEESETE